MIIEFVTLDTCHTAAGVVVVIDVCRAFTSAAYAFGSGAERILLAGTVAEALSLRDRFPGALVMGEVDGLPVAGFDLWNAPSELVDRSLRGRILVQRTSSGTQGVVRATGAEHLFAGSFAVAGATARAIQKRAPRSVTFVITGAAPEDPRFGIEDRACAEYMAALLCGEAPDWRDYMNWEADMRAVHRLERLPQPLLGQFEADLVLCQIVDPYPWALAIRRSEDMLVMEKEDA